MYENGTGHHQQTFDRLRALIPHFGYTDKRWLNAFICLHRMYYAVTHEGFGKGFTERFRDEVACYILPLFPAFDLGVYEDGDRHMVERQMDMVLNIMGAVAESEFQTELLTVWYNNELKQISIEPVDEPNWQEVTFGSKSELDLWRDAYLKSGWLVGDSATSFGITGRPFQLGGFRAEFRETEHGLTLFLSNGQTEVASMHLTTKEKRLGDAKWTDLSAVIPHSAKENGYCTTHGLLTPDDLPTVYMREDGKLYCQACHCTVPNTANYEMKKEGFFSHSHICGFRAEGEVYDD